MGKILESLSDKDKQSNKRYKYWWIICIYLLIPTIMILLFDKHVTPLLKKYMIGVKVNNSIILNSEYTVDSVINPFIKSMSIIISFIMSYIILRLFQKKLLKNKIYFIYTNECIKFMETIIVLSVIVVAVYGKANSFDYFKYGYRTETITQVIDKEENVSYLPLEKIVSLRSIGIEVNELSLYNILLYVSQLGFYLSDNLEIIIAIAGAVVIPLKNYSEKIEGIQTKDKCKSHKK